MPENKRFYNSKTFRFLLVFSIFCTFGLNNAFADHQTEGVAEEMHATEAHAEGETAKPTKFEPGKMILEHVKDGYGWHLWGTTTIPLPMIIYSKSKGLQVFSSGHFGHNPHYEVYNGYTLNHESKLVSEDPAENFYDFSITKNVLALLIGSSLLLIIFLSVARSYTKRQGQAPKGLQSLVEPLIIFIRDEVAGPSIGPKAYKFVPFLLTIFFFIFINNLLGLVPIFPGGANLTGNIAITMVLALMVFVVTSFSGNKTYWKHIFMPDVPKGLWILLIPIEIIGVVLKPFVLMLRLFANITAGHIIILGFFSLIFIFGEMNQYLGGGVGIFSVAFTTFMSVLELLVAFLQAYVFTLLASLYIGAAVEEHHHAEDKH
ncbi:MAG: F0F1 ATP synthase subunit A [Bacteroidia bacterium]|nr:F0F1 ATP synthase subunit A [Bacteroidia bacterium]